MNPLNPNIHELAIQSVYNIDGKGQTVNGSMRNREPALSSSTGLYKHIEITLL